VTTQQPSHTLQIGLAFVSGVGITLMVVAAAVGVVGGVESAALGLLFAMGTAMLLTGIIVWFAVVRPDTRFDDINEPQYHGHHDEH
jgi:uncharacterized membrane protein